MKNQINENKKKSQPYENKIQNLEKPLFSLNEMNERFKNNKNIKIMNKGDEKINPLNKGKEKQMEKITNINKNEIENYLIEILKIDKETTKNFIDLIYDDNEEDKNNVSTNHFIEKYTSLLKILETTESDDEEKNIKNKNDINKKEIEFGGSQIKEKGNKIRRENIKK